MYQSVFCFCFSLMISAILKIFGISTNFECYLKDLKKEIFQFNKIQLMFSEAQLKNSKLMDFQFQILFIQLLHICQLRVLYI